MNLAATVVLLRGDPPEVLMVRRSSSVAFGGMWVFPGGRIEPEDVDPQRPQDIVATARRAAVREAAEETAVVVDPDDLVHFALWVPPPEAPRRYQTWFFAAPAAVTEAVTVDGSEIEDHAWLAPADALERHGARVIELAPPTWITLWHLAHRWPGTVAEVLAFLARRAPEEFRTQMVPHGDDLVALWQGDAAYGGRQLHRPGRRRRLWMGSGPWQVEWSTPEGSAPGTIP